MPRTIVCKGVRTAMRLTGRSWIMGLTLRLLREASGLKPQEVTDRYLECSASLLQLVERGLRRLNTFELEGLLDKAYGRPELFHILEPIRAGLSDNIDKPISDPIAQYPGTSLYEELEGMATSIINTTIDTVPGLCQTLEYTRLQYKMEEYDDETALRYAKARADRQERLLERNPTPEVDMLITESAIHRASYVPGQLDRLADRANHPNISIRYIPNSIGPHLTACNFTLLEFNGLPTVLSTHVVAGGGLVGDREDVQLATKRRRQLFTVAETKKRTLELIEGSIEH